jgi:TorA maturation chaperone TorD
MTSTSPSGGEGGGPGEGRWELLRALGALALGPPAATGRAAAALRLPAWTAAEYTGLFVLSLPPYASIHLGGEGRLGGEGADRIEGVWRALGLTPPSDADHLGAILALYAELGEAAQAARGRRTRERLDHIRTAVLWEHLWSWAPGYLVAAGEEDTQARPWARLLLRALSREAATSTPAASLPLALRTAPAGIRADASRGELLDTLSVPLRTGFILARRDVGAATGQLGLGLRRGERRFALKAMLEQDAAATLGWLAEHAAAWSGRHGRRPAMPADPCAWWRERSAATAVTMRELSGRARHAMDREGRNSPPDSPELLMHP